MWGKLCWIFTFDVDSVLLKLYEISNEFIEGNKKKGVKVLPDSGIESQRYSKPPFAFKLQY